jgi:hypothetical protein
MRYRLRTLLIVLALAPPLLAAPWLAWQYYREYKTVKAVRELFSVPPRPQPKTPHVGIVNHD